MTKFIIVFIILIASVSYAQRSNAVTSSSIREACYYRDFELKEDKLLERLRTYLVRIEEGALPLISILHSKDSSCVYLSSTIAANSIKNSPPSYISVIEGKEVAVYNGQKMLNDDCLNTLVKHYRTVLQIDKSNAQKGLPPGDIFYYSYDPIWVKITLVNNKLIDVDEVGVAPRTIPFFKFSF